MDDPKTIKILYPCLCFSVIIATAISVTFTVKVKQSVTGLEWPRGFQEVKVPRFHDNGTGG